MIVVIEERFFNSKTADISHKLTKKKGVFKIRHPFVLLKLQYFSHVSEIHLTCSPLVLHNLYSLVVAINLGAIERVNLGGRLGIGIVCLNALYASGKLIVIVKYGIARAIHAESEILRTSHCPYGLPLNIAVVL